MNIPYFDAHCDTVLKIVEGDHPLCKNEGHIDLERGRKYRPYAQVFAIFGDFPEMTESARSGEYFDTCYNLFVSEIKKNVGKIRFVATRAEFLEAEQVGESIALLSCEGGEALGCSPRVLRKARKKGLCMAGITWNYSNALSGCGKLNDDMGLTPLGREFVQTARDLHVLVDVSHLSNQGFWDVAKIMDGNPFLASHSNSKTVRDHFRNLTDEQFSEIVRCGGVTGINLYDEIVSDKPDINALCEHIDHFLTLGGQKNLAIGADFDGCDRLPYGIDGLQHMDRLYNALLARNFSEGLVRDIFYNNLRRVIFGALQ